MSRGSYPGDAPLLGKTLRYASRTLYEVAVFDKDDQLVGFIAEDRRFRYSLPSSLGMVDPMKAKALTNSKAAVDQRHMGRRVVVVKRTFTAEVL